MKDPEQILRKLRELHTPENNDDLFTEVLFPLIDSHSVIPKVRKFYRQRMGLPPNYSFANFLTYEEQKHHFDVIFYDERISK